MKLYGLALPGVLGFLLSLPFCLSCLFFSTHSPNPWSHQQRWLLPPYGKALFSTANPPCTTMSVSSGLAPLNHTSVNSSAKIHHHHDSSVKTHRRTAIFAIIGGKSSRGGMSNRTNLASEEDVDAAGQGGGNETSSYHKLQIRVGISGTVRAIGLMAWLGLLFYLLGTTASDYFSCTLEKLSEVLNLSPAVAGVTLLAIGNGAPDVFSSIAAFASSDRTGSIGLGSVLGSTLFITTVVSGLVALVTAKGRTEPKFVIFRRHGGIRKEPANGGSVGESIINGSSGIKIEDDLLPGWRGLDAQEGLVQIEVICFTRDVIFLLLAMGALTLVLLDGEVKLWEVIAFLCIYLVYALFVWITELMESHRRRRRSPLLDHLLVKSTTENSLPQWVDGNHVQEHPHYHVHSQELEAEVEYYWEDPSDHSFCAKLKHWLLMFYKYCIEWPLEIPRQLTIPVVEEGRWSRKLAIASCTLAPVFVAAVWVLNYANYTESTLVAFGIGGGLGVLLGLLAYFYTNDVRPPQRLLTLWLAGGFFMSVVWFYLVANELVQSLEGLGNLFGINTTILALTVLAWGNSIGDLVADLSLACNGPQGVRIAISGCYAGPLFNTVIGLGLSMLLGCLKSDPEPFFIADEDGSLFYIIGFLAIGLVWALVILPLQGMRLGRSLGIGLIVLYCSFLVVGVCYAMGWLT